MLGVFFNLLFSNFGNLFRHIVLSSTDILFQIEQGFNDFLPIVHRISLSTTQKGFFVILIPKFKH